jgi:hypothetical protein
VIQYVYHQHPTPYGTLQFMHLPEQVNSLDSLPHMLVDMFSWETAKYVPVYLRVANIVDPGEVDRGILAKMLFGHLKQAVIDMIAKGALPSGMGFENINGEAINTERLLKVIAPQWRPAAFRSIIKGATPGAKWSTNVRLSLQLNPQTRLFTTLMDLPEERRHHKDDAVRAMGRFWGENCFMLMKHDFLNLNKHFAPAVLKKEIYKRFDEDFPMLREKGLFEIVTIMETRHND